MLSGHLWMLLPAVQTRLSLLGPFSLLIDLICPHTMYVFLISISLSYWDQWLESVSISESKPSTQPFSTSWSPAWARTPTALPWRRSPIPSAWRRSPAASASWRKSPRTPWAEPSHDAQPGWTLADCKTREAYPWPLVHCSTPPRIIRRWRWTYWGYSRTTTWSTNKPTLYRKPWCSTCFRKLSCPWTFFRKGIRENQRCHSQANSGCITTITLSS